MVEAVLQETQSNYLKPAYLKEKQLRKVVILDEFTLVESTFKNKTTQEEKKENKYTGKVECVTGDKPVKTWSMNKTSSNSVIRVFGPETKNWIGCTIVILPSTISNNESIIVDEIATRELNPTKAIKI